MDKVNIVRTMGKIERQGPPRPHARSSKKAYVTLKKDSKPIEFFEGMAE